MPPVNLCLEHSGLVQKIEDHGTDISDLKKDVKSLSKEVWKSSAVSVVLIPIIVVIIEKVLH